VDAKPRVEHVEVMADEILHLRLLVLLMIADEH